LRPALAIPIHWGTFTTLNVRKRDTAALTQPPKEFAAHAATMAPDVTVRILRPGDGTSIL
jgi:L-ascorbate metabolism protein UlaG (beta-lactamase superfamily)